MSNLSDRSQLETRQVIESEVGGEHFCSPLATCIVGEGGAIVLGGWGGGQDVAVKSRGSQEDESLGLALRSSTWHAGSRKQFKNRFEKRSPTPHGQEKKLMIRFA